MGYIKFIDDLPRIVKIIFAIIPFFHLLFAIYLIIKNVIEKADVLVWVLDIVAIVVAPVFWVGNIIWTILKGEVFSLGRIVAGK